MNALIRFTSACIALAVIFAAGCGGGGGDGGVVNPPPTTPPTTPPPTGGITRTGVAFAVGPITGFGSVIVNGVRYDTSATTFTKDGLAANQDDFSVGQIVLIEGTIDDDNTNAAATTVESNDAVEGPVSSVTPTTTPAGVDVIEIIVLGQTVWISLRTSIDDSCPVDLTTVPAVEVYGIPDVNGVIDATRIECRDATWDGVMEVNGFATNVTATTFEINALTVNYSGASVDDFPTAGVINEGDPVEAKGTNFDPNTVTLGATRVEYKGNQFAENEGDHIEIEGFITRFASATDFDVSGRPVTTIAGTTVFEGGPTGTSADLNENLKVEVEGEFDGSGVLVATKVEIKTATAIRVTGRLDSVPPDPLAVLGITINTDSLTTRFEDKAGDNPLDQMKVGDLMFNDYVEIRGQEMPTGEITAMIVERDDPDDSRIELRGFVTADTGSNLTVLGVTIFTDGTTIYRDSRGEPEVGMSAVDFWAAVDVGSLVDARGTETDIATLTATELELEME